MGLMTATVTQGVLIQYSTEPGTINK
jgi:hypothetical protein